MIPIIPVGIDQGQSRLPRATIALVLAEVAVFIYMLTLGPAGREQFYLSWGFVPKYESLATLVTHMFLHGDWLHLFFNLVYFTLPAMKIEDAIGSARFLGLFLTCGIAAAGAHVAISGDSSLPLIGASGAFAGIIGGFMTLYPSSRLRFWLFPPFPLFISLPSWFLLGLWFLWEIASGLLQLYRGLEPLVAIWAHVGGFLFGALSMLAFYGWNRGVDQELRHGFLSPDYYTRLDQRAP